MYVKEETSASITIEKSVFICYLKHVESEEEYKSYLSLIRKKHYDARHVASSLILGNIKRSSDDGEPSGTAGKPMLNVLEKNNLDYTCALVVRYFGGIKLGTGGLTRAYSQAVIEALNKAVLAEDVIYPSYELKLPYDLSNKLDYYLENNTLIIDKTYGEEVTYIIGIDDSDKLEKIKELTKGISPVYLRDEIRQKVI